MVVSARKLGSLIFLAVLLVVIGYVILHVKEHERYDVYIVFTFYLNIGIFLIHILKEVSKRSFSFCLFFDMFALFFFGFAALLQFFTNQFIWRLQAESAEVLICNLIIFLWAVFFYSGRNVKIVLKGNDFNKKYTMRKNARYILCFFSIFIMLYYIKTIGLSNLFLRSTNSYGETVDTTTALLAVHGLRNISLYSLAFNIVYCRKQGKVDAICIIAAVCFLVSCFPTAVSRNVAAAYYMGLIILTFPKVRKTQWLPIILIVGLVVVFPLLGNMRNATSTTEGMEMVQGTSLGDTYLTGDYDAFSMIMIIRRYVLDNGATLGRQLLGVLLFFVPRKIWPTKPIGTGATVIGPVMSQSFANVSAPLIGEAYVNGGVLGTIVMGFIVGIMTGSADNKYWKTKDEFARVRMIYPFNLLQFFFMMRGDLLSSWAYFFATYFVGSVIWKLSVIEEKA